MLVPGRKGERGHQIILGYFCEKVSLSPALQRPKHHDAHFGNPWYSVILVMAHIDIIILPL